MPQRCPHLSRVFEYAAAVRPGQGHGICRDAVWPIRGVRQVHRAAGPLCKHLLALVHSVVEEGEVLGVEFAGEEVGEVADLHRNPTRRADDKAGNASRVANICFVPPLPVGGSGTSSWQGNLRQGAYFHFLANQILEVIRE